MSLRLRVLAGLVFIALVLGIGAFVLTSTTRSNLQSQLDAQLRSAGVLVGNFDVSGRPGPGDPNGLGGAVTNEVRQLSTVYIGYVEADGTVQTLYAPDISDESSGTTGTAAALPVIDVDVARSAAASGDYFTVSSTSDGLRYRVLAVQNDRHDVLLVALPMDSLDSAMSRLITIEIVISAVSGAVLILVGWWVIHLGVRPLKSMTKAASAIAAGELSARVPQADPATEAGQLGVALNTMLERIEGGFVEREQARQRLQQFVADASHELRTPVATIRGYAELFRHGGLESPEALGDAMRRTEQESIRMAALVDDLLLLAKLDARRPLARERIDVAALAADAVHDASVIAPDRRITLFAGGAAFVEGDEHRIRQVLANLIGNALVHTPRPTPIEVVVESHGTTVGVAVVDHGAGIPADAAERVFERFVRTDSSRSRDRGGSGLGLSIVEAVVTAHGGSARIVPTAGGGTTVIVTVPAF